MNAPDRSAELVELARLAKRTLQHQQRYFKATAIKDKRALLRECRDYERRLMAAAEAALDGDPAFVTPPLPGLEVA